MKKTLLYTGLLAAVITLSGCATNARSDKMVYAQGATNSEIAQPKNKALINGINVSKVSGGHETNPLWISKINDRNFKEALEKSLQKSGFYAKHNESKYALEAVLIELQQPLAGVSFTVSARVHYTLKDIQENKIVYDKKITSSYKAKFSESVIAATRLKKATEGAARENIKLLINDLSNL